MHAYTDSLINYNRILPFTNVDNLASIQPDYDTHFLPAHEYIDGKIRQEYKIPVIKTFPNQENVETTRKL